MQYGVAERWGLLKHFVELVLCYNNLTALAKSEILTPERTLKHHDGLDLRYSIVVYRR